MCAEIHPLLPTPEQLAAAAKWAAAAGWDDDVRAVLVRASSRDADDGCHCCRGLHEANPRIRELASVLGGGSDRGCGALFRRHSFQIVGDACDDGARQAGSVWRQLSIPTPPSHPEARVAA